MTTIAHGSSEGTRARSEKMATDGVRFFVMNEPVVVRFALDTVAGMNRHRVSVWGDNGELLCSPSAESPADLTIRDGDTIYVEASVPAKPRRNRPAGRDERRWQLRAAADARAILNLGTKSTNGSGTAIEIRVEGAEQQRLPRA